MEVFIQVLWTLIYPSFTVYISMKNKMMENVHHNYYFNNLPPPLTKKASFLKPNHYGNLGYGLL